jgi:hypothetical protein
MKRGAEHLRPRTRAAVRVVVRLQRWWRAARRMVPTNQTEESRTRWRVRAGGRDVRCPISYEPIELAKCVKLVTRAGPVLAFSVDALAGYLRASGRFRCPCTQEPLNAAVVSRIERRAMAAGVPAQGLRGAYEMRALIASRELERANRVLAYESSCGADLAEALDICADFDLTRERALRYLRRDVLPQWRQTTNEFMRLDREACATMLRGDVERLRRLASVGDADLHGALHVVVDCVEDRLRASEQQDAAAFGEAELIASIAEARERLRSHGVFDAAFAPGDFLRGGAGFSAQRIGVFPFPQRIAPQRVGATVTPGAINFTVIGLSGLAGLGGAGAGGGLRPTAAALFAEQEAAAARAQRGGPRAPGG